MTGEEILAYCESGSSDPVLVSGCEVGEMLLVAASRIWRLTELLNGEKFAAAAILAKRVTVACEQLAREQQMAQGCHMRQSTSCAPFGSFAAAIAKSAFDEVTEVFQRRLQIDRLRRGEVTPSNPLPTLAKEPGTRCLESSAPPAATDAGLS